jgi:hypothetical protein
VRGAGVADNDIDPSMRSARTDGRSPAAILVSTFSDELALFYNGQSKIFGVSVKDRGAITLAGHAGKAFWFSKQSGEFVTSSFYYPSLPDWVNDWNAEGLPATYASRSWELLAAPDTYRFGEDDRSFESDLGGFGRTFPHPYGPGDSPLFTTLLTVSPAGDELTLDFVETLIENEEIGADAVPDYLAVSFSSNDYVGHFFGPSSLESEDNLRRLDRTLAELFTLVDDRVGLQNTVIVLSADHGGAEAPGHLKGFGFEADYVDPTLWDRAGAIAELKTRFGVGEELIISYAHPYVYLNQDVIKSNNLDPAEVEGAVAAALTRFDGVSVLVMSLNRRLPHLTLTFFFPVLYR